MAHAFAVFLLVGLSIPTSATHGHLGFFMPPGALRDSLACASSLSMSTSTGWERRLSDSHIEAFQRDRFLPVRRLVDNSSPLSEAHLRETFGALACRLLDSPASYHLSSHSWMNNGAGRPSTIPEAELLAVALPAHECSLRVRQLEGLASRVIDLQVGDALAYDASLCYLDAGEERFQECDVKLSMMVSQNWIEEHGQEDDVVLAFEDKLWGKRVNFPPARNLQTFSNSAVP